MLLDINISNFHFYSTPLLTDDSASSESTSKAMMKSNSRASPEVVPSYGKIIKNLIDYKVKTGSSFWNKENGEKDKEKVRYILYYHT